MHLTDDTTDAALDRHFPPAKYSATSWPPCDITPRCSGPCDQGRLECRTPDVCNAPETVQPPATRAGLALILLAFAVFVTLIGVAWRAAQ